MIDNNTQWFLFCVGWACLVTAALLHAGLAAAFAVLGAGFLRASGLPMEQSVSALLTGVLAYLKPAARATEKQP